jgi:hypothetical protein
MAHRWNGRSRETSYTEWQKFSNCFESIVKTSELAIIKTNDIKKLHTEVKSNLEKLRSLESEINAMAVKWGVEPTPTKEVSSQIENTPGIPVAMPFYALE